MRIIKLQQYLVAEQKEFALSKQVLRSGTSVGAQYREAQRAKSDADFINKVEGSSQELDETAYWLELIRDCGMIPAEKLNPLSKETDKLTAIFVTNVKKVKARRTSH